MTLLLPLPLETILQDVRRTLDAELYYPAILVSLTIPEICAGLAKDRSRFVKEADYVGFVDNYTTPPALGLDGKSCYQIRGGLVHRADLRAHPHFGGTHVIFITPESRGAMHGFAVQSGDKLAAMIDMDLFCGEMTAGARRWYADHASDPVVDENVKSLIRLRPNGVAPFVRGLPVVASGE